MWWLLGLLGLIFVSWGVFSAHQVLYPAHVAIPIPAISFPHVYERLSAFDGSVLEVWVFEAHQPRAQLLLCHGFYANRYQVFDIAQGLSERGYEVIVFELRGHGNRSGPCTLGLKETQDALGVLRWAQARHITDPIPLGALGLSMGGALVCQIAAQCPNIRAIVTDSVYSRLLPVIKRTIWRRYHIPSIPFAWVTWWSLQLMLGRHLAQIDPAALAINLQQPLLAIQGGEDRRVVPMLGREFYRLWAGPKERWFESTVAHVGMFAQHPKEYCNRVADFFDRTLAG